VPELLLASWLSRARRLAEMETPSSSVDETEGVVALVVDAEPNVVSVADAFVDDAAF